MKKPLKPKSGGSSYQKINAIIRNKEFILYVNYMSMRIKLKITIKKAHHHTLYFELQFCNQNYNRFSGYSDFMDQLERDLIHHLYVYFGSEILKYQCIHQ